MHKLHIHGGTTLFGEEGGEPVEPLLDLGTGEGTHRETELVGAARFRV